MHNQALYAAPILCALILAGCGGNDPATSPATEVSDQRQPARNSADGERPKYPVILKSDVPDTCALLTKEIAEKSLNHEASEVSDDAKSCTYIAMELRRSTDQKPRSMSLFVTQLPWSKFSSSGAYAGKLGERLAGTFKSYDRLDFMGETGFGQIFMGDDGTRTQLILVPKVSMVDEAGDLPIGELLVIAWVDNSDLGLAGRNAEIDPLVRQLAEQIKEKAQGRH